MKKSTIFKITLLILILTVTFLIIRSTYSKYITATDDNTSLHIANWNIKLNNKDIKENKDFSDTMDLIFDENEYIDNTVIAPTSTGSFNVNLESTGTEIPYLYLLNLDSDSNFKIEFLDCSINKETPKTKMSFNLYLDFSYYENFNTLTSATISLNIPTTNLTKYTISNSTNQQIISQDTISFNVTNPKSSPYTFKFELEYDEILDLSSKKFISNITINSIPFTYRNKSLADFEVNNFSLNSEPNIDLDLPYLLEIVFPEESIDTPVIRNYNFNFRWNDTETNILNNANDVIASKTNSKASLPLELDVVQIIEEK